MFEKLEQLRKLPDSRKRMIALGSAASITFVIFLFWAVSLSVTLGNNGIDASAGASTTADVATIQSVSPFAALTANVKGAFAPIANAFSGLASYFSPASSTASSSGVTAVAPMDTNSAPTVTYGAPTPSRIDTSGETKLTPITVPINLGDTGPAVTDLQEILARIGVYTGPINGKYGPATQAAMAQFQASHGIVALHQPGSGLVGQKTRDLLNSLLQ